MASIKIIGNLYHAFRTKDHHSFRALCSEDVEWIQSAGFPSGGHHYGIGAVIEKVFKQFEKDWEYFKLRRYLNAKAGPR